MKRSRAQYRTSLPVPSFCCWFCASVCFGQRQNEPRPAPLDPVQAEKEARALVAEMLAQKPDQNTTNTGRVKIRDAAGKEREIPVRFEITATPTNWVSVYETLASAGRAWRDEADGHPLGRAAQPVSAHQTLPKPAPPTPSPGTDAGPDHDSLRRLRFLGGRPRPGVSALAKPTVAEEGHAAQQSPAKCWRASTRRPSRAATRGWCRGSSSRSRMGLFMRMLTTPGVNSSSSLIRRMSRRSRATINWRRWRCGTRKPARARGSSLTWAGSPRMSANVTANSADGTRAFWQNTWLGKEVRSRQFAIIRGIATIHYSP